jgi:hypothetical protein
VYSYPAMKLSPRALQTDNLESPIKNRVKNHLLKNATDPVWY